MGASSWEVMRHMRGWETYTGGDAVWDVEECASEERGRGTLGEGVAARVFKGDIGGAEEVTAGEWGYNEECFLTFLACPPHCSRLMRRWRDRARVQRQDKLSVRRPARSGWAHGRGISKRWTWEGTIWCQLFWLFWLTLQCWCQGDKKVRADIHWQDGGGHLYTEEIWE